MDLWSRSLKRSESHPLQNMYG